MEDKKDRNVVNHFEAGSNCQVFNGDINGCVFAMPGSNVTQVGGSQQTDEAGEELARRIAPFLVSEEEAKKFPTRVKGLKDKEIAMLVKNLWQKFVIRDETKPTDIWRVLHDLGFYDKSDRNWSKQVTFEKRDKKV